jgi:HAE1 family hydrophobic/amphiphilic exporter-1
MLYFKGTGPLVPLDTAAHVKQQIGPQTVSHAGPAPPRRPSRFGPGTRASLGTVLTRVGRGGRGNTALGCDRAVPRSGQGVRGCAHQPRRLLVIAILIVYIVLGVLYESYITR